MRRTGHDLPPLNEAPPEARTLVSRNQWGGKIYHEGKAGAGGAHYHEALNVEVAVAADGPVEALNGPEKEKPRRHADSSPANLFPPIGTT